MDCLNIIKLDIENEMDVMLAHRRAMQFARFSGITLAEQTRFGTAVSEICRNVLEYPRTGEILFNIQKDSNRYLLEAVISDKGGGIADVQKILMREPDLHRGRGLGLVYARRLADAFQVMTSSKGTKVILQQHIPAKFQLFTRIIIDGWLKHLSREPAISAYEELKIRNSQLMELTEELRANGQTVEKQMAEIRQLNRQLSENNARMKEFTYAISHDLKNPLSSLKIAVEQLSGENSGDETALFQGVIARSVNRLNKTIHSLIEILDIQNREKRISRELEFKTVLQEAIDEYNDLIMETGAEIRADFSAALRISYVEGYLSSIFHNLLSNSLKYRRPGERPIISILTKPVPGGIVLSFSDNGIGMDMQRVKGKLFTPFTRFSLQAEGKGIGLYLVKGMVESNGGKVEVDSELGEGTKFSFKLIPY